MSAIRRAAVPVAASVLAVGLAGGTAWAGTPADHPGPPPPPRPGPPHPGPPHPVPPPPHRPPPPPPGVSAKKCRDDGGHVVRDRHEWRRFVCEGGRWDDRTVYF